MTTEIKGIIYFSPRFKGEPRTPCRYYEIIDGDSERTNGKDTSRTVYLNGLTSYLSVYNSDEKGVLVLPEGPEKQKIKLKRGGRNWKPKGYEKGADGLPITASVKGFGQVEIEWRPYQGHK